MWRTVTKEVCDHAASHLFGVGLDSKAREQTVWRSHSSAQLEEEWPLKGAPCSPGVVLACLPEKEKGTMVLIVRVPEIGFQLVGSHVWTSKNGKCDQNVTCQLKSFLFDGNQKFFRDMH